METKSKMPLVCLKHYFKATPVKILTEFLIYQLTNTNVWPSLI